MGPANSLRISRVLRYSGAGSTLLTCRIRGFHLLRPIVPNRSTMSLAVFVAGPITPTLPKQCWFGLFRVRSPLLAESLLFSFPAGSEMFQFPAFASLVGMSGLLPDGLPHSEIRGSMAICAFPRLFAAYHVLLRFREPRHPPCALVYYLFASTDNRRVIYVLLLVLLLPICQCAL